MNTSFLLIVVSVVGLTTDASPLVAAKAENEEVKINAPDPDIMYCAEVAQGISSCIAKTNFPFCNGTKSQLQVCLEKSEIALSKCNLSLLRIGLKEKMRILKISDRILCESGLYKEFPNNLNCWTLAKTELIYISALGKGFLTDDGCRVSKINRDAIIGYGYDYPNCSEKLISYLVPLYKQSSCGNRSSVAN